MTMTLTFTGNWCDIAVEMRAMLNTSSLDIRWLKVDGESIPAAVPADPEPVADTPAPRTRRTKATTIRDDAADDLRHVGRGHARRADCRRRDDAHEAAL